MFCAKISRDFVTRSVFELRSLRVPVSNILICLAQKSSTSFDELGLQKVGHNRDFLYQLLVVGSIV